MRWIEHDFWIHLTILPWSCMKWLFLWCFLAIAYCLCVPSIPIHRQSFRVRCCRFGHTNVVWLFLLFCLTVQRPQVCREYQRGACKRAESECRFAHPLDSVTAHEDGCVTVCMDAVKGRCSRDPCRYFHPPLHLQAHIKAAQSRAGAVC